MADIVELSTAPILKYKKINMYQQRFFEEVNHQAEQDRRMSDVQMLGIGLCNIGIALYLISGFIDLEHPIDSVVSNAPWLLIPYMLLRKGINQIFQSFETPQIETEHRAWMPFR